MNFTKILRILLELALEGKRILANILVTVIDIDGNTHINELVILREISIAIGLIRPYS